MSNVEASFDEYKANLAHMLYDKVDADLAMKIMYLERKLPDAEPKAELDIKVRSDAVAQNLKDWFGDKLGYQVSCHKNHITATGRISIERLAKFASNSDIEWISGSATPASY
ncbi:MAG: hypothetical protein EPO62_00040 [Candidatus Nitrosotenuis sp.]|nr:MAG: hypothetical protein EPO62_00040 [Candidatus Nitrosotenuis sp.]